MIVYERSNKADYSQLKELWNVVFNEEKPFLESFFSERIYFEHIFVARTDDRIVAALHALPSSYTKRGKKYPCSYIVGAATLNEFRSQGIMGNLLELTRNSYGHPITLFPAVRPYYEKRGYFTTSSVYSYPLNNLNLAKTAVKELSLDFSILDEIYTKANSLYGSLSRDNTAWKFLTDGYKTILIDKAYALIKDDIAVEATALDKKTAKILLSVLIERGIKKIQILKNSPFVHFLNQDEKEEIPMGMATNKNLKNVYIAEQY